MQGPCGVPAWIMLVLAYGVVALSVSAQEVSSKEPAASDKDTGYRGIWYCNQPTGNEYAYKYSGGLGTYCADHIPMCVYAPAVNKTFFVYGGTKPNERDLLAMVSYYDHQTGTVPRPTILIDKKTEDAHDNPVIALDHAGYVWVFASAHGKARPSYIFKSQDPYSVENFDLITKTNFSYPQPWYIDGEGFLFLHTSYDGGRVLCWQTSKDGITWSERKRLASIEQGQYQISWPKGRTVGTAFNYHPNAFRGDPAKKGLNWRTNLYYLETGDLGTTWRTVQGEPVRVPLTEAKNPALVVDYEAQGLLAYLMDLNYDAKGRPVILYLTATTWEPGPEFGPREWHVAHWTGSAWAFSSITRSDNNYDMGSIYVEPDGTWRVIGPTETGPQPFNPGGEVAIWTSRDEGASWQKRAVITHDSRLNHTYCRRPLHADPDFYAFWADGDARRPSESRLYFCDKTGQKVMRLPEVMEGPAAKPERVE